MAGPGFIDQASDYVVHVRVEVLSTGREARFLVQHPGNEFSWSPVLREVRSECFEKCHLINVVGNAGAMTEQEPEREAVCIWQSAEPGLTAKPPLDLAIEIELTFVNRLEDDSGDKCLSHASGEHPVRRLHWDLLVTIRPSGGRNQDSPIRHRYGCCHSRISACL